jgi:hypothetical protein
MVRKVGVLQIFPLKKNLVLRFLGEEVERCGD